MYGIYIIRCGMSLPKMAAPKAIGLFRSTTAFSKFYLKGKAWGAKLIKVSSSSHRVLPHIAFIWYVHECVTCVALIRCVGPYGNITVEWRYRVLIFCSCSVQCGVLCEFVAMAM